MPLVVDELDFQQLVGDRTAPTMVIMVSPGIMHLSAYQNVPLGVRLTALRENLKEDYGGDVGVIFAMPLISAISQASNAHDSVNIWFQNQELEAERDYVVSPGFASLALARNWATHVDDTLRRLDGNSPIALLRRALKNEAEDESRNGHPILKQEDWNFLLLSAASYLGLSGRVFTYSLRDVPSDERGSFPQTEEAFDRIFDIESEYLGLPQSVWEGEVLDAVNVLPEMSGNCPKINDDGIEGNFAVVDANLIGMGRVPDLIDHFGAEEIKCRIVVPVSVQLEVARKVVFGNDTALGQARFWSEAWQGQGPNRKLRDGNPLLDQVRTWSRALHLSAGEGKFCSMGLAQGGLDFLEGPDWQDADIPGAADLVYAAAVKDIARENRTVLVYTDDNQLRTFVDVRVLAVANAEGANV